MRVYANLVPKVYVILYLLSGQWTFSISKKTNLY